jgi:hypothetical protein
MGEGPLSDRPRPSRPSWRSPDGGRTGLEPGASRPLKPEKGVAEAQGRSGAEDGAGCGYFASRCKGPQGRRKIAVTAAIAGPDRLPSDRPLEGHGRNSIRPRLTAPGQTMAIPGSSRLPYPATVVSRKEACNVLRRELSSLKSPSLGDKTRASMPALSARDVKAAAAPMPAASASQAM